MFNRVSAVVVFVRDFNTCLTFYRDTLGLPVAQLETNFVAFRMKDQNFALQALSAAADMFHARAGEPTGKTDPMMLCTQVDNVDAEYERLTAKGVEFVQPPTDQYWGIRAAYFRDPEGNLWEMAQPSASA